MVRLHHNFRRWAAVVLSAALLSGCRLPAPVVGLRPIDPPVRFGSVMKADLNQEDFRTLPVKIHSLHPELRWKPLFCKEQNDIRITEIAYDLKIWRDDKSNPSLVYARENLPEPRHRLETALEASTQYCWSIRARLMVNGEPRFTQWSFSRWPSMPPGSATAVYGNSCGLVFVPTKNYFRFETAADSNDAGK